MDNYCFSNEQIDRACRQVEKALVAYGVERREALRLKLTFEEILLEYQETLGENAPFRVRCSSRFSVIRVEITVPGAPFDPMDQAEEEAAVMRELLAGLGLAPAWSYKNGKNNIVLLSKKKPLSNTVKTVGAIVLAESCGIPITLPWILLSFLTVLLVNFAVPPIPGGAMLGFTIVFAQLGIPMEAMGVAIAINAIADFPATAGNVSGWQLTLIDVAASLDMIDQKVLREENPHTNGIEHGVQI